MIDMTKSEIESLLAHTRIGRLAMVGRDLQPYIIPMPFCWLNDYLYLRLPMEGRKGKILQENRSVCFEVDWHTESLTDYASVLIEGALKPVEDIRERKIIQDANSQKYLSLRGGYRPGHGRLTALTAIPLQKIAPVSVSGRKKEPAIS